MRDADGVPSPKIDAPMLAFVILAHQEFDSLYHMLRGIYHEDNTYCVCVNISNFEAAVEALNCFRELPNFYLIPVPPTSWGEATEAYITGIDFCLQIETEWESLLMISGADLPLVDAKALREMAKRDFGDNIVCLAGVHPIEVDADVEAQRRLLADPFKEGFAAHDMIIYNPFPYAIPTGVREGLTYVNGADCSRTAWTKNSHFITTLSQQVNAYALKQVVTEKRSGLSRRALYQFFEGNKFAMGSFWGQVLPRDFCAFLTTDQKSLAYFSLASRCFSGEESFFATMAFSSEFSHRILYKQLVHSLATVDPRISMGDIAKSVTAGKIFARKIPSGDGKAAFVDAAYALHGIDTSPEVERLWGGKSCRTLQDLLRTFSRLVSFDTAKFRFGSLGQPRFADVCLHADGGITYSDRQFDHSLGDRWSWTNTDLRTSFDVSGDVYARFDSFRCAEGRILILGNWLHHFGLPLVLQADLGPLLEEVARKPNPEIGIAALICESGSVWEAWFGNERIDNIAFQVDHTFVLPSKPGCRAGYWRMLDGALVVFGFDDMLISVFDIVCECRKRTQLAGVSVGKIAPVDTCILRKVDAP